MFARALDPVDISRLSFAMAQSVLYEELMLDGEAYRVYGAPLMTVTQGSGLEKKGNHGNKTQARPCIFHRVIVASVLYVCSGV